ncbi:hypothetical protein A5721_23940 [Mycobacterium vulneris]|nr:hypothetical protein A5721_23940 [Mycolicibacterium vulneris]
MDDTTTEPEHGTDVAVHTEDGTLDVFRAPALSARPLSQARAMLTDHVAMMRDAFALADGVCYTAAVPERYRGKPKDGAAAILYGAPLGMDPMTSLQKVINVHGTPGLEARSMKGLLISKGFDFRTVTKTTTEYEIWAWKPSTPVVRDMNPDSPHYGYRIAPDETSNWTIERAQQAKYCPTIDPETGDYHTFNKKSGGTAVVGNMKYIEIPTEMLEAKGTADVCRAIAPDVLMGMPYTVEELETQRWAADGDDEDGPRVAPPAPARAKGTAGLRDRARARKAQKKAEPEQAPMDAEEVPVPDAAEQPAPAAAPDPTPVVPDQPPAETSPAPPKADDTPVVTRVEGTTGEDLPGTPAPEPVPADTVIAPVGEPEATAAEVHPAATAEVADAPLSMSAGTAEPEAAQEDPAPERPADDMQMTPAVRSKGEDMLVGLLINGGIATDEYRPDALSEVLSKRPDQEYRRINNVADLSNGELKWIVDTLRAWKTKGQLESWLGEAVNNAALRDAGMLDGDK